LDQRNILGKNWFYFILTVLLVAIFQTTVDVQAVDRQVIFTELGSYPTGVSAFQVTVIDDIAYVTDDYTGFFIINVSNPFNPTLINHTIVSQSYSLFIDNNLAYIGTFSSGVIVFDITNLTNPIKLGSFDDGGSSTDIQVVDDLAFVANYGNGFEVLNITNPTNITKIGFYDEGQYINSLAVVNDIAFITVYFSDHDSQLVVLNISNPINPIPIIHSKEVNGSATLQYKDGLVFFSSWSDGLIIMNFSDVYHPIELGSYRGDGVTTGSFYVDDLLFLGKYTIGLKVLDVSDLNDPKVVGEYYDGGSATNMFVVDDLIYVADKNDGLEILQFEIQESTETIVGYKWFSLLTVVFILYFSKKIITRKI